MKVLPCDLFGQVILRPRWRYIYSTLTYIYMHIHTESMLKYSENPQMDRRCTEGTGYVFPWQHHLHQGPNKRTFFSFPAVFLFSHIFPLSHTFVDVLCCLGETHVRDQRSVLSCLLSTAGNFAVLFCFFFFTPLQACVQFFWCFSAIMCCLIMLYSVWNWSPVHF